MRNLTLAIAFCLTMACSPRAEIPPIPTRVDLPFAQLNASGKKALWLVTSNYTTGGRLIRLDLATGEISTAGLVGQDAVLVADGASGFFILSRMSNDGIATVTDRSGRVADFFRLPNRSNPQWAARDRLGRVWITTQEIDQVFVLDAKLKNQVGSVDLSALKTTGGNAALAQVIATDRDEMVVTAQRIHRSANIWKPDPQAGIAVVDLNFNVLSAKLIELINPISAKQTPSGLEVMGAGDYTVADAGNASRVHLTSEATPTAQRPMDGKVIGVAPDSDAVILHQPLLKQSCILIADKPILCEQGELEFGYIFSAIHRADDVVFVSYKGAQKSELWILSASGSFPLRRIRMDLPVLSLVFGP